MQKQVMLGIFLVMVVLSSGLVAAFDLVDFLDGLANGGFEFSPDLSETVSLVEDFEDLPDGTFSDKGSHGQFFFNVCDVIRI